MSAIGPDGLGCLTDHAGVMPHASVMPHAGVMPHASHCITCSDEGVAMTVIALDDELGLATCEDGDGTRCTIDIGLVDPVAPGAMLLTHAGTAIAVLAAGGACR